MPSKLAVPGKRFSPNDVETYVDDLNEAMQAVDDSVNAFNQQVDAIDLAEEQVFIAKQHAAAASNAIPIIEGHVPTNADFDRARLNELNNFPVSGHLNVDKATAFEFRQVAGWENKFKLKANKTRIDGVWHDYADTMLTTFDAPNGLQNKDLASADFTDLSAAIVAGGTDLSQSYLTQRVVHYMLQEDIVATPAQSIAFIQDPKNNFYHENGVLRQRVMTFEKARLLETVAQETGQLYTNSVNAMTSLGWTLSANTLGEFDKDGKKAVVIGILNGRNQGAFHPSFHDLGCSSFRTTTNGIGITNHGNWARTGDGYLPTCKADCMSPLASGDEGVGFASYTGSVAGGFNQGRDDNKFYDAIYSSDLESSMMNVRQSSYQEIRESNKRKAMAAQIDGVESVPFTKVGTVTQIGNSVYSGGFTKLIGAGQDWQGFGDWSGYLDSSGDGDMEGCYIIGNDGQAYPLGSIRMGTNGASATCYISKTQNNVVSKFPAGTYDVVIARFDINPHKQTTPHWTNIVGNFSRVLALFTTVGSKFYGADGIYGQWIPNRPDGTPTVKNFSRKGFQPVTTTEKTDDNGLTWINTSYSIDSITNDYNAGHPSTTVALHHYETKAHFTKDDASQKVFDVTKYIRMNQRHSVVEGALLTSSLIGKVPTYNGSSGYHTEKAITTLLINANGFLQGNTSRADMGQKHEPFTLTGDDSPALKILDYLSSKNGVALFSMAFKELIFDVDWGDNNEIEIVTSGQESFTDDNGNTGTRGMASFETQDFIVEY
jgi:hypothetical protein